MSSKKKIEEDVLSIEDLAFGGWGISKIKRGEKDFVVFVDGALPGQRVKVKYQKIKRRYAQAKVIEVLERSKDEIEVPYQLTPGAGWMKLPINLQKKYKQEQVESLFKKFAQKEVHIEEFIHSPDLWAYRNKMDYSFGPTDEEQKQDLSWNHFGFGLGSKKRGQFHLVENLEKPSGLFDTDFESKMPKMRLFFQSICSEVYNARKNQGFWRQLVVRKSFHTGGFVINIITNIDHQKKIIPQQILEFFQDQLGSSLEGLIWTESNDLGNALNNYQTREILFGSDILEERINGLKFLYSFDSFFQTNPLSAEKLYDQAARYNCDKSDQIMDLFCGAGTLTQIMASKYPEILVQGVEIVPSAVKDAQENAKLNNLKNTHFVVGDVGDFLKKFERKKGDYTIFIDPPRGGMAPKTLQKIINMDPKVWVYISCNPATMARDTKIICQAGWKLEKLSLVDQFPHTSHVECVGRFIK